MASTSVIPSWVNFEFTGRKSDVFAASIPTVEEIVDFAYEKYVEDYREWSRNHLPSEKAERHAEVRKEILLIQEILDYVVPKLTPLQRRGLLWGLVRRRYLYNIRHRLYENRGRYYDSIINIGYNSVWEYPNQSSEFWFWNEVPASVELTPSKEFPQYYK